MTKRKKITVVTIAYNSSPHIEQCIESVLGQELLDFEYLIIDDCSTDDTWKRIMRYQDQRIRAYRNDPNIGEYNNRNKAVEMAQGDYIIFIDGDDLMYNHALSVFQFYLERFSDCGQILTRPWDSRIIYPYKISPVIFYQFEYLDNGIMGGNFTNILFNRSAIIESGYFDPAIKTGDSHMQMKIAKSFYSLVIPDGLTWWRRRKGNATSQLFSDNKYMVETINYRLHFLNTGPLPDSQKHLAKQNMYGLLLRNLVRLALRFKLSDVIMLATRIRIPVKYWISILSPARTDFFNNRSGDDPLQTP